MKILFRITSIFLLILIILLLVYYLIYDKTNLKNIQPIIAIGGSVVGMVWAISGIILNWTSLKNQSQNRLKSYKLNYSKPIKYIDCVTQFINRKNELGELLRYINNDNLINVFGHKGSGKSEILKLTCDLINGFHKREIKKKFPKSNSIIRKSISFYSDLSEVAGVINIFSQFSDKVFGEECDDAISLAYLNNKKFGRKKIILILDNINSLQAGTQLLENVFEYLRIRKHDKILIGSVEKIFDVSKTTVFIEIKPLSDKGIIEYINGKFGSAYDMDLQKVKSRTRGLPIFLNLLIVELENNNELSLNHSIENYLSTNILNALPEGARKLLVFLSYFNLSTTNIKLDLLINFPLNEIDLNLDLLRRYSTIIDVPSDQGNYIKVHDLIRDLIIKQSKPDQLMVNEFLYNYYIQIKDKHRAILHWLLVEPKSETYNDIIEFLRKEIELENYPYQVAIWDIFTRNRETESFSNNNIELQQILLYGYVRALLGSGDYKSAEILLNSSQFGNTSLPDLRNITKEIELEYHLSIADIDHLLGRYHQAYEMAEILLSIANNKNFLTKEIECEWFMAHLIGHTGSNIHEAIKLYNNCLKKTNSVVDALIILKCKNGIYALEAATNNYSKNFEQQINITINIAIKTKGAEGVVSSLLRNKARFLRRTGNFKSSKDAIDRSLKIARSKRLRTIFNCYLAYGDLERFQRNFEESISYYKMVIDFTNVNGDEHLKSSAIGGILISEICSEKLLYHESWEDVNIQLTKWIDKANDLGLEITKLRLNIIGVFLNNDHRDNGKIETLINNAAILNLNYEKAMLLQDSSHLLYSMEMHIH